MEHLAFARWCEVAVRGIRYKPDRAKVYDELYAHLEDRFDALSERGTPKIEAEAQALAAMGSAEEVAEQMEQIHRPFWGYLLRFARWLLLVAAVLAALTVPRWLRNQWINFGSDSFTETYYEQSEWERDGLHGERVFYAEPMSRDFSDGYRFTLTRAAEWHTTGTQPDGISADYYEFYLTVEVFNPRPWMLYSETLREFYALDSLGNRYAPHYKSYYGYGMDSTLAGYVLRTGYCTQTWQLWLSEYCSHGADWIELRYDRSGRDVRLRVVLPGGDAA